METGSSPYSPARDADALDDTDANLSHEHKEEDHEVEGTVAPVGPKTRTKHLKSIQMLWSRSQRQPQRIPNGLPWVT